MAQATYEQLAGEYADLLCLLGVTNLASGKKEIRHLRKDNEWLRDKISEFIDGENKGPHPDTIKCEQARELLRECIEDHEGRPDAYWMMRCRAFLDGEIHEQTIEDGYGSSWSAYCPMCGRKSMHVARPGKAQCSHCG